MWEPFCKSIGKRVKEDKEVGKKLMWLEVVIPKEESEKPIAC